MAANERSGEELRRDVEAYVASCGVVQRSTERADRERAEAAILGLYASRGLALPEFLWVPSPVAGVMAWHAASQGREPVRNQYTLGDQGTGANQPFNALAEPFAPEPRWGRKVADATESGLPDALREPPTPGPWSRMPTFPRIAGRLGLVSSVLGSIAAAVRDIHGVPRGGRRGRPPLDGVPVPRDPGLARLAVGARWGELEALIGPELLEQVALDGIARAVADLLDPAASIRDALQAMNAGQFDAENVVARLLPAVLGVPRIASRSAATVDHLAAIAASAGPWWALERLVIVSERPLRLSLDERGRLHSTDGPALAYPDGFVIWAEHGVTVPEWLVTEPQRLAVEHIDAEENAEVRRVMIERFGAERLIREGDATLLHEDAAGRLWRRENGPYRWSDPVVMVEVVNSTPEPDGSRRTYFLRVPPDTRTATAAVAWTFGMRESEYAPARQT